ncbi:hypothetical protein JCM10450v2_005844 [Rhodotorula kratochvilovae]
MGRTATGYHRKSRVGAVYDGIPRYKRDRNAKDAPGYAQHDKARMFTIHPDPPFHAFLLAHGYSEPSAHAFLELLCSRIEAWLVEAWQANKFDAYRVWVVAPRSHSAPYVRSSPGLLQDFHLVLRPLTNEFAKMTNGRARRECDFYGVPQILAQSSKTRSDEVDNVTERRCMWSDNYHKVTPETYLARLPAGTFLLPSSAADKRITAARIERGEPIEGVALVCEGLPATFPRSRRELPHRTGGGWIPSGGDGGAGGYGGVGSYGAPAHLGAGSSDGGGGGGSGGGDCTIM